MGKRGRPKKVNTDDQWGEIKSYKEKPSVAINALAKLKRERVLAGYSELFKIVFSRDIKPYEMKVLHKIVDEAGF